MPVNVVTLCGNIVRDAELHKASTNGTPILDFSIAVNDRRHNSQTDTWEDYPNFFDITVFGKRAEAISKWCLKGVKVTVSGRLRQNTWKDKDTGKNRSRVTVIADDIDFMSRGNNGQGNSDAAPTPVSAPAPQQDDNIGGSYDDEDVPF